VQKIKLRKVLRQTGTRPERQPLRHLRLRQFKRLLPRLRAIFRLTPPSAGGAWTETILAADRLVLRQEVGGSNQIA